MTLSSGTKLAHYEIVEPIGKGGMGEVYRARDGKLGREVAIKVLPDEFSRDAERLARFKREAKVLASLNHPNIAAIHGLEESDGTHYLVLELVPGETLADRIARGPIALDESIAIAMRIAEGLEEAHEQGIVHRDLKPANIKLTPDDKVKILDFGLAKAFVDEAPVADDSMSPTITRDATRAGVILGTAAYMSPEQAKGKRVDRRTDIFAFGSVLYEMLSGKKAFRGDGASDVLAAVIKDDPDWDVLPSDAPPSILRVVRRCLAKPVARRLRHIGDARLELEEREPAMTTAQIASNRSSIFLLATTLIATAVAAWALLRPETLSSGTVSRWSVALPTGAVFPAESGDHEAASVVISPNGRYLAYRVDRAGTHQLYLRAVDELEAIPVDGGVGALMPFFSPDSQTLAFISDAKTRVLMKVSVEGGAPVVIANIGDVDRGGSWGPDGNIYFNPGTSGGLNRISAEGGEQEVLASPRRELGEKAYRFAEVLPQDTGVLFTIVSQGLESFDDASIAVFSFETGEVRILLEGGFDARYSSTGHLVYARAGALYAMPFDASTLAVSGAPVRVLDGITTWPTMGPADFSLSRDGTLVYLPGIPMGIDNRVVGVDREGGATPLVEVTRAYTQVRLAPDGHTLALATNDANMSLWAYDIDRSVLSRLVSGSNNLSPVWAPDGSSLAFSSDREGTISVFLMAADGRGDAQRLLGGEPEQRAHSWAPDGRTLAVEEDSPQTGWDIWLVSPDRRAPPQPFVQTRYNERRAVFSPNGHWIAFQSDESGRDEIYVCPYPQGEPRQQVSVDGGEVPRWNPNGRELFFRNGNKMMALDVETEETLILTKPNVLFESDSYQSGSAAYDISADGSRFVMIDRSQSARPPKEVVVVQNWTEELKRLVPTN